MTEEEAKTKWCPMVRYTPSTDSNHAFDNREQGLGDPAARCIASACMAWRQNQKPNPGYRPMQGVSWPEPWPPIPMYVADPDSGYCGLAGVPR